MEQLQLVSPAGSLWADPYHASVPRGHRRGVRVQSWGKLGKFDSSDFTKAPHHPSLSALPRKLVASISSGLVGSFDTCGRILPVRSQSTHDGDQPGHLPHVCELSDSLLCVDFASGERKYDQARASTSQDASEASQSSSIQRGEKQILVDRLMLCVEFALASCASRVFRHRGTGGRSESAFSGLGVDRRPQGTTSDRPSREGVRPQRSKRLPEDDDGDDEGDGPKRRRVRQESGDAPSRLACPYFKNNPRHYRLSRSCPGPGWATVHRVKEHLYRCHRLPIHCLYCHEVFDCDRLLQNHLRADQPCKVVDLPPLEGVNASQEKLLRSRKKTHKDWSEAEKWADAYQILFPGTDAANIPSPYYDYSGSEEDSRVNTSSELGSYEQYLREELPKSVRRALETRVDQAVNPIEEALRVQIVDIVRNCQLQLFETYRVSRTGTAQRLAGGASSPAREAGYDSDREQDANQPDTAAIGTQFEHEHPEYCFDPQFEVLSGDLFDFTDINFDQEWDSGYGSSTMTDVVTPDMHKTI